MADSRAVSSSYDQSAWEDEVWAFVFATADAKITYGGARPAGKIAGLLTRAKVLAKHSVGLDLVPNPYFVLNGICEDDSNDSSTTAMYLRGRLGKSIASTSQSVATGALKSFTVVDPVTMAVSGVSIGSTIAHMAALSAIAKKWRNSKTVSAWLNCLLALKMAKLGHKTLSVVSASIPYMPPGASTVLQVLSELPTAAGVAETAAVSAGAGALVKRVAIELHWRAYREHVLARAQGAVGPASAILVELFTKRTQSRILGKHDIGTIIKEPAGWMAISDKIGLL